jgi:uncharacterized protein (TIGR03089 family)
MRGMTLATARLAALRAEPGAPLITDCTQARVELSRATFDNWVTKTVNFLRLEAGVEPGSGVAVMLPLHWMAAVWCVAVWEAGADLVLGREADLTVGPDGSDVVVVADPLGMAAPPDGLAADWFFPADVRGLPDALVLPAPPPGGMPGLPAAELAEQARNYAQRVGLAAGGRLHTEFPPSNLVGVLALVGAPLAVGAGVVLGPAAGEEVTAVAVR